MPFQLRLLLRLLRHPRLRLVRSSWSCGVRELRTLPPSCGKYCLRSSAACAGLAERLRHGALKSFFFWDTVDSFLRISINRSKRVLHDGALSQKSSKSCGYPYEYWFENRQIVPHCRQCAKATGDTVRTGLVARTAQTNRSAVIFSVSRSSGGAIAHIDTIHTFLRLFCDTYNDSS